MEKRGLSGIVLTIIMIGLVLVAVGIVWGVISNILTSQSEDVETSFQALNLDLKIERALVEGGVVSVTVKRGSGSGDVSKLNFVFSDGVNAEVITKDITLKAMEKKTINFSLSEINALGILNVNDISIVDVSKTGKVGSIRDSFELSANLISDAGFLEDTYWTYPSQWDMEEVDLNGNQVNSAKVVTDGNVMVMSDYMEINPYKNYKFSLWIKTNDGLAGRRYLGFYAYDSNKVKLDSYSSYYENENDNRYFWLGDIPANDWKKVTGYVFACDKGNTWEDPSDTTSLNYRMLCDSKYLRLRFLNYYNYGTSVTNWFALPTVEEVKLS